MPERLLATRAQKAFIGTITIQAIVVLAMVGIVFRKVQDHVDFTGGYKTLPCYLALFALAEIFEGLMAFNALQLRNVIQLIGILVFHGALAIFSGIQIMETRDALTNPLGCTRCAPPGLWHDVLPFLIVVPCVIVAAWAVMGFFFMELYSEFGWAIFHVVGANPRMKRMYQWYQIMLCLLKFDFFFFIGVSMQLLIIVLAKNTAEFGVTVAAIPVVLVLLAMCGIAVQREIKWALTVSLTLMLAALSYLYKLVRIYEPASRNAYSTTRISLTIFIVVAFILLFGTFAVGLRCFADFDRGLLASKVNGQSYAPVATKLEFFGGGKSSEQQQGSYYGGAPVAQRISIE
ncbi:hypothetical protein FB45DRAFT_508987 [Roridomyces roridus]|uniref:Uncharacterized protein n=1 Tax=Roridomyces roridus TaxID=1738132 RepID=A0AAD7FQI2_9AGAR|nr:hypothetical protein FB45DRAFT_508987 [Roridomyces roridus]